MFNTRKWSVLLISALLMAALALSVSAQESITLTVWDNFTRDAEQAMIVELHAQFVAEHPEVHIVRISYDTSSLTDLLPLSLASEGGPDVVMINQGFANMGALVEAGLLLPLNDYADQFGWWDRYGMGLHTRNMWSADGTQFGGDTLYGVSNTAEVVGVFYWRSDFEELGLSVPQTLEEFETVLAALHDAGKTPIVFGSLDGWPAIHTLGAIQHSYGTREEADAFTFRYEGGTYATEANLLGAQTMVDWVNAGYFSPGFEGMDYDNATTGAFLNHEGAMWITGSWMAGGISQELGEDQVGFFLVPPAEAGAAPLNVGGVGLGYGIRSTSANPDLAAEYIDLMTSADAGALLLEYGYLPAVAVESDSITEGTLTADVIAAWNTISGADAVGHYWDWTVPDIAAYIQELLAGVTTPEAFIETVEAEYRAAE